MDIQAVREVGSWLRHELVQGTARTVWAAGSRSCDCSRDEREGATRPAGGTRSRTEVLLSLLLPLWGH